MNARKVLLIEPPYRNKYPPMGLMKLASYFRGRGDDVRFFKGDLKTFAANIMTDEFLLKMNDTKLCKYRPKIFEFIKTGKYTNIESIDDFYEIDNNSSIKKISQKGNTLFAYRQKFKAEDYPKYDVICVTTLFTFYWNVTVKTINEAKKFLKPKKGRKNSRLLVGGIASTILPQKMFEATGIKPIVGLLNSPYSIDKDEKGKVIIDELPLDYSILNEIDYEYPASNAYFGYMTRGCPNKCSFCAVPKLEPNYCNYIGIKNNLKTTERLYGAKKDLLLMDNNVFASNCYDKIIDEIRDCGFGRGAVYTPPNEYDIAMENLRAPKKEHRNVRVYIAKMLSLYDQITTRLSDIEQGDFCLKREELRLYYPGLATKENIIAFDEIAKPLYEKLFKRNSRVRYIDFNQGVDARLVTDEKMKKMAEINIRPLRIAFDHYEMKDIYIQAIKTAARYEIKELSNYLLYNFKDKPEHLYERMRINVDLCEQLKVTIYSFPMKYHPIDDPEYFDNRDYIGDNWNRKFIRAIQAVLNATKGKIGRGKEFFEQAFGRNIDEFNQILWMPETFIIYRRKYDAELRERLKERYGCSDGDDNDLAGEWREKFNNLPENKLNKLKEIVANNNFKDINSKTTDKDILEVLYYYTIGRKEKTK